MTNLEKYKNVFINVFGVEEDMLNENFTFELIEQWDSVSHLSLISELEDTFDIMYNSDEILHYGSFQNGIEILKKYGIIL